ncbi:hypothetical protein KIPB_003162 [Kipferlia bialata]|uniref:Uncharacterized protein n=1 Tax=Kipferlia bialata TaxID=797122 RepID=A0A9K3CS15_9EUKA|nr:hypothetical protein KIPB_003162 [Kipferlia bialata]|eukprot:g3162.t1
MEYFGPCDSYLCARCNKRLDEKRGLHAERERETHEGKTDCTTDNGIEGPGGLGRVSHSSSESESEGERERDPSSRESERESEKKWSWRLYVFRRHFVRWRRPPREREAKERKRVEREKERVAKMSKVQLLEHLRERVAKQKKKERKRKGASREDRR